MPASVYRSSSSVDIPPVMAYVKFVATLDVIPNLRNKVVA